VALRTHGDFESTDAWYDSFRPELLNLMESFSATEDPVTHLSTWWARHDDKYVDVGHSFS
jgi:hypothetical protein